MIQTKPTPGYLTFPSNANHAGLIPLTKPATSRLCYLSTECCRSSGHNATREVPGRRWLQCQRTRSAVSWLCHCRSRSTDVSATRAETVAEVTKAKDVVVVLHSHGVVIDYEVLEGVEVGGRWCVTVISAGGGLVFIAGVVLPVGVCCCFARGNGWRVLDGSTSWVTMLERSMHGNFWETKLCPRHRTFLRQAYANSLPLQQAHHGCGRPLSPLQQLFPNPNLKPPSLLKLLCLTQSYN